MFFYLGFLILGFFILIKGADFLVDGASSIAKKKNISNLVIGLTVVAIGTSFPELVVSTFAATSGSSDIAVANVLGSNISNTLLILGVLALIIPLKVKKSTVLAEVPFSVLATILVWFLANDLLQNKLNLGGIYSGSAIDRFDGVILLLFFIAFLYYTLNLALNSKNHTPAPKIQLISTSRALFFIIFGLLLLTLGGKLSVDNAIKIAQSLGISEFIIGATVVALGTSLPELVTSLVSIYKKSSDIAVGNIVGSNIFNLLLVLGVTSTITPISYDYKTNFDIAYVLFASFVLLGFLNYGKNHTISKLEGSVFVFLYVLYIALGIIVR